MAAGRRVLALHQAVQPQGLALVEHVHLIALPGDDVRLPGPGPVATGDALGHAGRFLGLVRAEGELVRSSGYCSRRHRRGVRRHHPPFQQPVHGLADAGRQRGFSGQSGDGGRGRGGVLQRLGQWRQHRQCKSRSRGQCYVGGAFGDFCAFFLGHHTDGAHQRLQALPPAVGGFTVRLDGRDHQHAPGAGHGHVQGVEFLTPAGQLFLRQNRLGAQRRALLGHQKHKLLGRRGLAGPVDQHRHAVGIARDGVGVQQQHGFGFQSLGAVNGQQAHGVGLQAQRRQQAAGLQGAHQAVGRGEAAPVQRQRHAQQRSQVAEHCRALAVRCGRAKTGQHVAVVINGLQRVMRWQLGKPAFPAPQHFADALQRQWQLGRVLQQREPGRGGALAAVAAQHRQRHQRVITHGEQGGAQRPRQRQVMLRRHQHVQQRHDVLHLATVDQLGLFTDLGGDVQRLQGVTQRHQAGAFARQGHDVAGFQAWLVGRAGDLPGDPRCGLARFQRAPGFFRQLARGGQAVAPDVGGCVRVVAVLIGRRTSGNGRQASQHAWLFGRCGVRPETVITVGLGGCGHHGVDGLDHTHGIAAGVVAGQQVATQRGADKSLCGDEHLRLGPTKPVNALLGVPDQKHAGRRTCPAIATEPGRQRLPLQRVGVLKFVNHQVLDPGVQPLLHPTGQHRVTQHALGGTLHVIHVHPLAAVLERAELGQQQPRQPGHALLVVPRFMLPAGRLHTQHQVLRFTHHFNADNLFTELAGGARAGQQRGQHAAGVTGAQRLLKLHALGSEGFGAGTAQSLGGGQQYRVGATQRVHGMAQVGQLREMRFEGHDGRVHHAQHIGHRKFDAFVQRRAQGFVRLKTPMCQHHGFVIRLQGFVGQQRGVKPSPDQGPGRGVVLQQGVVHRQIQALQHGHRGIAQQRRKPAVKRAYLHCSPGNQHRSVQV